MHTVPCLLVGENYLTESLAIIEYLDEAYPENPFLPKDLFQRAKAREIANIVADDIQPLQNLRVLLKIEKDFGANRGEWAKYWVQNGFTALEKILSKSAGKYSVGDQITMADILIIPQANIARDRLALKNEDFPTIFRITENASKLNAFIKAEPNNQPDAPNKL